MQQERTAAPSHALTADDVARVVLGTLLTYHPGLLAIEELVRDLDHVDPEQGIPEMFVREAVTDLTRCGLAHQLEGFVFASYSALRARELGSP